MSSTNKTTNYELSQFTGSDKPAWLTDYNQDMAKIDTGIHSAQAAATGADGKADANTTNIGDLSYLSTTAKNNLVAAINEVDNNAETAQNTANSASNTANSAKTTAEGIAEYLNINTFATSTVTSSDSATVSGTIRNASNADGSLGKIYGSILITPANAPTISITTNLRPAAPITIQDLAIVQDVSGNKEMYVKNVTIGTDGTATLDIQAYFNTHSIKITIPPCLLFIKDFGDQN